METSMREKFVLVVFAAGVFWFTWKIWKFFLSQPPLTPDQAKITFLEALIVAVILFGPLACGIWALIIASHL